MDFDSFLEEMDNDIDIVGAVVKEFISSLDNQMLDIDNYIKNSNYIILSREAHSIKGGARNLMAYRLSTCAEFLEVAAKNSDKISAKKGLDKLNTEVALFKEFIINKIPSIKVGTLS